MTSRNVIPTILLTGSAAVVLFLACYSLVLLGRTEFLARGTSIASDVIVGFHVLGASAAIVSAFAQRRLQSRYGWAVFGAACVVEGTFLLSNWVGVVWEYRKGEPDSLYAAGVQLISNILR